MTATCAHAGDDSLPAMDMLEFLADWETAEGEWIDPVELEPLSPESEPVDEDPEVPHE